MAMKKFLNDPDNIVRELLEGLYLSNQERLKLLDNNLVVSRSLGDRKRVHVVILGGSGHEPGLSGYVGRGMLDISVPGDIFAAPGPELCYEAVRLGVEASGGEGVLLVVLNHPADMMSADIVMERAWAENLNVRKIVTRDDVSVAGQSPEERRGLVGCIPLIKIAASLAAEGKPLSEIYDCCLDFLSGLATVTAALRGATHPQSGTVLASLEDDEMEIGTGQHGEASGQKMALKSADDTAEMMLSMLLEHVSFRKGDKALVLVSGSGSTTLMELLIIFRKVFSLLEQQGIEIGARWVGEIMTVQETAGFQLSLARMDRRFLSCWESECDTPYYRV
ncbi:MAG: dihydroxyacetone kinase subunit DhaK [Spirochaetales bacterium]|nr:dihydroxyacetone kinase subunit DhaK [Spirochaetales bacterium]